MNKPQEDKEKIAWARMQRQQLWTNYIAMY
jgi:hypothetical protein